MNNRTKTRSWAFPLIVVAVVLVLYYVWIGTSTQTSTSWNQFRKAVESGAIASVTIEQNKEVPTGRLRFTYNGETLVVNVSDVNEAQQYLEDNSVAYVVGDIPSDNVFLNTMLPMLIVAVMVLLICFLFVGPILSGNAGGGGGSNQMSNFGRSRAQMIMPGKKGINFNLVAGLEEEKEELEEVVDFLKDPQKYTNMGARIPKGILLVGSPGTGKTLLAKAVAGEANVPFFSISGSDFVEMFVGVGAARVRDLFASAKQHAPCIIFIDEIDAVARRRGTGMGGGHDEREQTLNQMLVEMDGFQINEGIIVMAATNRVDILDPAILRPGRFDRKVGVGRPDVKGRREILNVHVKNKPLGDDVDLDRVAKTTSGFTGADLENLVNEAAIRAAKSGRPYICQEDIDSSFVKVGIGAEKRSKLISDREKKITAYHESGHAILFHLLPDVGPVHTISIIPTGMGAAGYTMPLPGDDEMFRTKKRMLEDITVSLGGRIAEELVFGDVTTGASQDIKQATSLARDMVITYGMSDKVGLVCYNDDSDEVYIGRDLAHARSYGEEQASVIDGEIKRIIDSCYERAQELLRKYEKQLHECAELLLEKEKIGQEEFEKLFEGLETETEVGI